MDNIKTEITKLLFNLATFIFIWATIMFIIISQSGYLSIAWWVMGCASIGFLATALYMLWLVVKYGTKDN